MNENKSYQMLPIISISISLSISSRDSTNKTTNDSRHAMQVVNTTGIVSLEMFVQEWLAKGENTQKNSRTKLASNTFKYINDSYIFSFFLHFS